MQDQPGKSIGDELGIFETPTVSDVSAELRTPELGTLEVRIPEVSTLEVGMPEVSTLEVGMPEVSILEVSMPEVSMTEVSTLEISTFALFAFTFQPQSMLFEDLVEFFLIHITLPRSAPSLSILTTLDAGSARAGHHG
jgi:hypothetical protein